jgi:hypothetical protein
MSLPQIQTVSSSLSFDHPCRTVRQGTGGMQPQYLSSPGPTRTRPPGAEKRARRTAKQKKTEKRPPAPARQGRLGVSGAATVSACDRRVGRSDVGAKRTVAKPGSGQLETEDTEVRITQRILRVGEPSEAIWAMGDHAGANRRPCPEARFYQWLWILLAFSAHQHLVMSFPFPDSRQMRRSDVAGLRLGDHAQSWRCSDR